MGIEFRLGRADHKVAEDFVVHRPAGVNGIWLDAHNLRFQGGVIEAAKTAGLEVLVEPLTERLVVKGFAPSALPYAMDGPVDLAALLCGEGVESWVAVVVGTQLETATTLVPPHFYSDNDDVAQLNVDLATRTLARFDRPIRAVLVASRDYLATNGTAQRLAELYADAGVEAIELRLSPVGGEDESIGKVRSSLDIVGAFADAVSDVYLGHQGQLGQTALALGLVRGFSVGVGMHEHVNHAGVINRQTHPKPPDEEGASFGPTAGVHLTEAAATVPRGMARALYEDRSIRTRLACPLGLCSTRVDGPVREIRGHYLHARAHSVATLESRPAPWRPAQEYERLSRALEFRELLNQYHLPDGAHALKTRTLRSLLGEIDYQREALSA